MSDLTRVRHENAALRLRLIAADMAEVRAVLLKAGKLDVLGQRLEAWVDAAVRGEMSIRELLSASPDLQAESAGQLTLLETA